MVFPNSLWIVGLSLLLAAFAYHDWLARETQRKRKEVLQQRSWRLAWTIGMLMASSGWLISHGDYWWEKIVFLCLAAWFAWNLALVVWRWKDADPD